MQLCKLSHLSYRQYFQPRTKQSVLFYLFLARARNFSRNNQLKLAEMSKTEFLAINGRHVFITGAAGSIGSQTVREFLGTSAQCFHTWHRRFTW